MKYNLSIDYINFHNSPPDNWWKTTNYLNEILDLIYKSNIIDINYFYRDSFIEIPDYPSLIKQCNKLNETKSFYFDLTSGLDHLNNKIRLYLAIDKIGINIFTDYPSEVVFEKMLDLIWALYNSFKDIAYFGPEIIIASAYHDFPKYRPIRYYKFLAPDAILNFIHSSYFNHNQHLIPEGFENLFNSPLPKGVTRIIKDDVTTIKWTNEVENENEITKVLMQREDWVYKHIKLDPMFDFNELGDKELYNISSLQKVSDEERFFSYYKDLHQIAFKLLVLDENKEIDAEVQDRIKYYSKTKQLDNGDPIEKIILILPAREYAVKIKEKAKELGVYKVVYIDNVTNIWDMEPEGDWRN